MSSPIRRKIRANDVAFNSQFQYADNYIKTSKYSLLTFLPYNLFEQFRRLANTYFLCLLILQLIPQISSLTPITTAVPLIVVLAITGIKDAHDDICRHQSDKQVNNRLSQLLAAGRLVREPWHKVKVGDIIRIENDQFVAADLMILSTSEPNGFCFVETAELDGETNLKCRQSLAETAHLADNIEALAQFDGEMVCEPPNNNLTKFEGTLFWNGDKYPVDNDKMLLRGCVLRNTKWCFGLVVFAGRDTKLMQNSGKTIFKRTKSDRLLNLLIVGIVLALLTMCLFTSVACGVWELLFGRHFVRFLPRESFLQQQSPVQSQSSAPGLSNTNSSPVAAIITGNNENFLASAITAILAFFSYLIVLNTVVPISLYVSVEVIRYCQSLLIDFDSKMFYAPKESYAKARTSTLNEELGQVEYVFSDKTGTLTQNLMTFNKCSIGGRLFGDLVDERSDAQIDITNENEHLYKRLDFSQFNPEHYEPEFKFYDSRLLDSVRARDPQVHEFFTLLALCHTVMSEIKNGRLEYQAQSPDEAALSSAARNFGFVFKNRTSASIEVEILGQTQVYELLAILDFNNVRKRMSVIVRAPNGKILLYCKGADSVIFERLERTAPKQPAAKVRELTVDHLEHFAGVGLRTLCLAKKELDEQVYARWAQSYKCALTAIENREEKVDAASEQIESDLQLLGATAIEDKLQDNVPQTIANLLAANIKLWVLTGDKQETAINIGYSCELLNDEMCEIFLIDGQQPEQVDKQLRRCKRRIQRAQRQLAAHSAPLSRFQRLTADELELELDEREHEHENYDDDDDKAEEDEEADELPAAFFSARRHSAQWLEPTNEIQPNHRSNKSEGRRCAASRSSMAPPPPPPLKANSRRPHSSAAGLVLGAANATPQTVARSPRRKRKCAKSAADGLSLSPVGVAPSDLATPIYSIQLDHNNNNNNSNHHRHHYKAAKATGRRSRAKPAKGRRSRAGAQSSASYPATSITDTPNRSTATPLGGRPASAGTSDSAAGGAPRPQLGCGDPAGGFALVISGASLAHALCATREELFLEVSCACKSVICCRVTPLQKALVVDLVKRHKKVITLSIGDGANDVSMLKMAHIGVGISGQEGMQAVLASDYSVAQFSYLERLLLVHGRWSYFRMCKFLRYFFYKNFSFTLCNLWYAFFCGFSAQTLFDPIFISFYNVFYTSLPVLALGIFDQDVSDRLSHRFPHLYTPGHLDLLFNKTEFLKSCAHGILTSFTAFFVSYGALAEAVDSEGVNLDSHELFGCVVSTNLVLVVTAQAALDTSYWTVFNHVVIWGSVAFYLAMTLAFNSPLIRHQYVGVFRKALSTPVFWFSLGLVLAVLLCPILAYRFYQLDVRPTLADRCRHLQRLAMRRLQKSRGSGGAHLGGGATFAHWPLEPAEALKRRSLMRRSRRSIRSGYAFSHQEGFGNLITSGMIIKSSVPSERAP